MALFYTCRVDLDKPLVIDGSLMANSKLTIEKLLVDAEALFCTLYAVETVA